ncbi:S8 family serine peptidase [Microbispora sp. RL4-1S]|uniref:S8 family serine peptidase n=1 Tax=Microbispora oryzae TaxID=2806554 RepID=A0A940WT80_9ACTN|nr:S8 family serine peptidase [Microbispora oryzae]MBP2706995.1 S8 family serine peptidase [Microbispora oryzae]
MTSDDKPKNGSGRTRATATGRVRQSARQIPQAVEPRPRRYMVAALPQRYLTALGVAAPALDADTLHRVLGDDPRVRVHRRLPVSAGGPPLDADGMPFPAVVVADMTPEHADELRRRYPQVHVERDRLLTYSEVPVPPRRRRATTAAIPAGVASTFGFLVRDADGAPVPGATVFVTGYGWPAQAVTGADGRAVVTMTGETPESVMSVVVKPRAGFWSRHLDRPALSTTGDNLVELVRLSDSFEGFPARQLLGWGRQAMGVDRLPPTFRGAGVRIAVVDSGAAVRHPDLAGQVAGGIDLVARKAEGWSLDQAGHGSHCAAVVAGADNGRGVLGFAVEAETHACKIFPGGRFSDLIDALDYCIEQRIDVVNLSLGCRHPSPLVAAKIEQARDAGVACVVAAGNDGGPVGFPGTLPTVLTVAAIGRADAFPPGSAHAAEILEPRTAEGYFSPRFTCHGPEVDVCAPGVAILSAVPPDAYAALDGTSMAAPHVTGLAALVLAHHEDFAGPYRARDARRVDRLFQIIRSSCVPVDLGDPRRTGAGMPNALLALGAALANVASATGEARVLLEHLTTEMVLAGLLQPAPGGSAGAPAAGGRADGKPVNGAAPTVAPAAAPAAAPTAAPTAAGPVPPPVTAPMPPSVTAPGTAPVTTAPVTAGAPVPGTVAGDPAGSGVTALAWLAEEMRAAGLLPEPAPGIFG